MVELASQTEDWWTLVHATWEFGEVHHISKEVVIWRVPIGECSEVTGLSVASIRSCISRFQKESRQYSYVEGFPHCTELQIQKESRQYSYVEGFPHRTELQINRSTDLQICPGNGAAQEYDGEYVASSKNLPKSKSYEEFALQVRLLNQECSMARRVRLATSSQRLTALGEYFRVQIERWSGQPCITLNTTQYVAFRKFLRSEHVNPEEVAVLWDMAMDFDLTGMQHRLQFKTVGQCKNCGLWLTAEAFYLENNSCRPFYRPSGRCLYCGASASCDCNHRHVNHALIDSEET